MSRLKTDAIRNVNASVDGITLDTSGNVVVPSGRLNIGTTTEGHANGDELTLASSGNAGLTIRSGTSDAGNIYFSDATSGDGEYKGFISYGHNVDGMYFATSTSTRMFINSTGNIGIGTTSPAAKIEITDTSTAQIRTGYSATKYARIGRASNGTYEFFSQENGGELVFGTAASSDGGGAEKMRIDRYGHVGIGRSSGLQLLDVKGGNDDAIKLSASAYGGGHLRITGADTNISGTAGPYVHTIRFKTKTQNSNNGNGAERDALILHQEAWSGLHVASFPTGSVGIGTDNPTFASISGNSEKGLEIHNLGNDTAACLKLTGNNNSGGSPGQETYTQLEHRGGNLTFNINHNGTERFKIDAQGNVHASDGNLVVASGHGIDFSATSGTGTSELLDDYEEGTWTPALTNGPTTAATPIGRYRKIGTQVFAYFMFNFSGNNDGTAAHAHITNLPFTTASGGNAGGAIAHEYGTVDTFRVWIAGSNDNCHFYNRETGGALEGPAFNSKETRGCIMYQSAS